MRLISQQTWQISVRVFSHAPHISASVLQTDALWKKKLMLLDHVGCHAQKRLGVGGAWGLTSTVVSSHWLSVTSLIKSCEGEREKWVNLSHSFKLVVLQVEKAAHNDVMLLCSPFLAVPSMNKSFPDWTPFCDHPEDEITDQTATVIKQITTSQNIYKIMQPAF